MEFHLISNEFLLLYGNIKSDYPVITRKFQKKQVERQLQSVQILNIFMPFLEVLVDKIQWFEQLYYSKKSESLISISGKVST